LTTSAALSEQSLHAFAALAKSHLLQDLVSRTAPANACTHAAPTSSACSRERRVIGRRRLSGTSTSSTGQVRSSVQFVRARSPMG
jgi:hypothetical protein